LTKFILGGTLAAASVVTWFGAEKATKRKAEQSTGGIVERGRELVLHHGCGSCHAISEVPGAEGLVGPRLDQIASRVYIAGVLVNTPENLIRWIQDPPAVDPMTAMPNLRLKDQEVRDVAAFLQTLQ
jgi:cytochrome c